MTFRETMAHLGHVSRSATASASHGNPGTAMVGSTMFPSLAAPVNDEERASSPIEFGPPTLPLSLPIRRPPAAKPEELQSPGARPRWLLSALDVQLLYPLGMGTGLWQSELGDSGNDAKVDSDVVSGRLGCQARTAGDNQVVKWENGTSNVVSTRT